MSPTTRGELASILSGRRFAVLVVAVVVATSAPALLWWARTPPGQVGLGGDFVGIGDFLTYVSWVKQAGQGHLLFLNLYDPAPQQRTLFLPFFLALGIAGKVLGLSPILTLHLARVAASALLCVTARWFCRAMIEDEGARVRGFLMLTLATGLPALIPEASPVSAMFDSSLLAFSWSLILLGAGSWILGLRSASLRHAAIAGLCVAVLILTHPYDAVSVTVLVAATALVNVATRRRLADVVRRVAIFALCVMPAAVWTLWSLSANPALRAWAMFPRRTAGWELFSFGTIAILALFAGLGGRKPDRLILTWVATSLLLLFLPIPSQRRYIQGLQAPLAILAAQGFDALVALGRRRTAKYLLAGAFPMSVVMLLVDATNLTKSQRYVDGELASEIRSLETLPPGVIFSRPYLGQLIAPFAGRQVFAGHPGQTPDIDGKYRTYGDFAAGRISGRQLAALGVRWVVLDGERRDRPAGGGLVPHGPSGQRITVWEVEPE